jgi:uncharacterized membrane protein
MITKIKKIFLNGLITLLPLAVTIYILITGISLIENILGKFIRDFLPEGFYFPGYGFIATLLVVFIFGLLVNNLITATIIKKFQKKMTEIPLIKAVYSPLRDLINLFSKSQNGHSPQKVVLVKFSDNMTALGLVTREDFGDLEIKNDLPTDCIAVLFPMSYGLGGYTLLINKNNIHHVDMSVEKAMSLAVTGWIRTETAHTQNADDKTKFKDNA